MVKPEKHIKAIAINPTVMKVIPKPRRGAGTFEYDNFSRIAAKATIAINHPIPDPNAYVTASPIPSKCLCCMNKLAPMIAQFTAIKGKKIPNDAYNEGLNFSTAISTI